MEIINRKPIVTKLLVFLFITILIYRQDLIILFDEALNSEISTHIILLPFLIGYIIYNKRYVILANIEFNSKQESLYNNIKTEDVVGIILCLIAYLFRLYGSYTFNPLEFHIASLPIFISGLILIFFNYNTLKTVIFPVFFLMFLIPPPFEIAQQIGGFLAVLSALAAFNLLKITGYPVSLESRYGNPIIYLTQQNGVSIPFTIDIGCSGLYSFIGLLVFSIFFTYLAKGTNTKKILVMISGFPILFLMNIVRISLLLLVGYYFGIGLGLNIFHLLGGWTLTFVGTLILIALAEKIFKVQIVTSMNLNCAHDIVEKDYCTSCGEIVNINSNPISSLELGKYLGLLLIALVLVTVNVPAFSLNKGNAGVFTKDASGNETITSVLPEISGYNLQFVMRDNDFEEIAGQNASLLYLYNFENRTGPNSWVQVELGTVKGSLHNWETCLINYPALVGQRVQYEKVSLRDIHLLENPPISAKYFSFYEKGENLTQVVLYWFAQSIFQTDNGFQNMWSKISVIQYVETPQEYKTAEKNILPIAQEIVSYWEPISYWSEIALTIAQNGPIVIGMLVILFCGVSGYNLFTLNEKSQNAKRLISQIDDLVEKGVLDALSNSKSKTVLENDIQHGYKLLIGREINLIDLRAILEKAKAVGIVNRIIVNINDKPHYSWAII